MANAPDPFEPYLNRAASLFDLGDIVQAGQIWQAILKRDPGHQIARAGLYKVKVCFDARATQDGMTPPVAPVVPEAPPAPEDPEALLRDGCTLFEMGEVADALKKWEKILAVDPDHALARTYANNARKDLGLAELAPGTDGQAPAPAPSPAPMQPPVPDDEDGQVAVLIREGVQLYDMGMLPEATAKWLRVLAMEPGNQDAADYIAMAERDQQEEAAAALRRKASPPVAAPSAAPAPVVHKFQRDLPSTVPVYPPAAIVRESEPEPRSASLPPKALTTRATPARDGLKVPGALNTLSLPSWLRTPARFSLAVAGALLVLTALFLVRGFQRERALKEAVLAAKAEALKPVARQVEVATLVETPEAIRSEAEKAMGDDPLLAYLRAQECLRLDQGDTKAARLLEQARTGLAAKGRATREGFEKSLKAGELEAAHTAILGLLCQNPEDPDLRGKARAVSLALAQHYAAKERFGDAKECLCLVRAMYPQETVWQAKLKLLEAIQGMPKAERNGWIAMLG